MSDLNTSCRKLEQDLALYYIEKYPEEMVNHIKALPLNNALKILIAQKPKTQGLILRLLPSHLGDELLSLLPDVARRDFLQALEPGEALIWLRRCDKEWQTQYLQSLKNDIKKELEDLLAYPNDTAGSLMDVRIIAFHDNDTAIEVLRTLKQQKIKALRYLFLVDADNKLHAQLDMQTLALAEDETRLSKLSYPVKAWANELDPKEEIVAKIEKLGLDALPVVDHDHRLVGLIRSRGVMSAIKEEAVSDLQTMVGASKDERALSSSIFAVKKRLPWLEINLLTAFLAAAVVGLFEKTIAQYTALAILLPVAAGQSGNAGAQALAVTMRGLTLREINMRHWWQVLRKEFISGFLNGIAVAATCFLAVYVWSQSWGLATVTGLAMVIAMTIACGAGALVPIALKRFGLDPAQSSSIILTTVTDVAGFMCFLGIASLLSRLL